MTLTYTINHFVILRKRNCSLASNSRRRIYALPTPMTCSAHAAADAHEPALSAVEGASMPSASDILCSADTTVRKELRVRDYAPCFRRSNPSPCRNSRAPSHSGKNSFIMPEENRCKKTDSFVALLP